MSSPLTEEQFLLSQPTTEPLTLPPTPFYTWLSEREQGDETFTAILHAFDNARSIPFSETVQNRYSQTNTRWCLLEGYYSGADGKAIVENAQTQAVNEMIGENGDEIAATELAEKTFPTSEVPEIDEHPRTPPHQTALSDSSSPLQFPMSPFSPLR